MNGPRSTAIGNLVDLQRGTTYKSKLLGQPGPVLLGLATIERDGGFRSDKLKTYGGESPEKLILYPGDIYVSLKDVTQSGDLLGSAARVPSSVECGRLTQDTVKLEFKNDQVPRDYIYWILRTPGYRQYCRSHATGTTNLGLPREDFLAYPIPPITTTRSLILEILEATEAKIELNRRMNRTLEAIAQAIFKSWFVDFEPVKAKAAAKAAGASPAAIERAAMAAIAGRSIEEAIAQAGYFNKLTPSNRESLAQTAAFFPDAFEPSPLGEIPKGWSVEPLGESIDVLETGRRPKGGVSKYTSGVPSVGAESIRGIGGFDYSKTKFVPKEFFESMKSGKVEDFDVLLYKDGGKPIPLPTTLRDAALSLKCEYEIGDAL